MSKSKLDGRTLEYYKNRENISNNDIRYIPQELKEELIRKTIKCNGSIRERLYWLRHDLTDYPTCDKCKKSLSSKQFLTNVLGNMYRSYCSKSCARTTEEFKEKSKQNSILKYGVDHPFKVVEIQEKRKQTNLKKYGREHSHPWGSEEFKTMIVSKYGTIEQYLLETNKKVTSGLISHYIDSGKIIQTIQSLENKFNVQCLNTEELLNENRVDNNTLLSDIPLEWFHNFCKKTYTSSINDGTILVCSHCRKSGSSILEQTVLSEILLLGLNKNTTVIHRDRTILKPKEIDIFIPGLNLGIEINGIYWHNGNISGKYGFLEKSELAKSKNITLIHINEEQWINKKSIILSKLKYYFHSISEKINARDCEIRDIPPSEKNEFLETNHLQGKDNSKIKLGLYYNDVLVSVMTFGSSRFNKKYDWELIRYCVKQDIIVNGSFGKLFKHFKNNYCKSGDIIVSFRDLSWGLEENNIYTKNGFTLSHRSEPSYSYISTNSPIYISRYKTQKHKLHKLLGNKFNPNLSESENMKLLGYHKFYNCGNDVYIFNI